MWNWRRNLQQDYILLTLTICLSILGLISVFSTTYFPDRIVSTDFWQQLLFILLGFGLYSLIIGLEVDLVRQKPIQFAFFALNIILLVTVILLPGESPKRWLGFGVFSFQPSELAKVGLITLLPTLWMPISGQSHWKLQRRVWLQSIFSILAVFLLIWVQPSLGNSLIILILCGIQLITLINHKRFILASMLCLVAGICIGVFIQVEKIELIIFSAILLIVSVRLVKITRRILFWLAAITILGTIILGAVDFSWQHLLTDYQKQRITAYVSPAESDPLGAQWQVLQARIAIGSGQLLGKGLLQGTQVNNKLLPYAYTDFAYSALAEQLGVVGIGILMSLLLAIVWRIAIIAKQMKAKWDRAVCIGVMAILVVNAVINISMNLGLMPVTGVPLPLVSYGGTAVLTNLIALGLVQMLYAQTPPGQKVSKLSFQESA